MARFDKVLPDNVKIEREGWNRDQPLIYETENIRCSIWRKKGHLPQKCPGERREDEGRQEGEDTQEDKVAKTKTHQEKERQAPPQKEIEVEKVDFNLEDDDTLVQEGEEAPEIERMEDRVVGPPGEQASREEPESQGWQEAPGGSEKVWKIKGKDPQEKQRKLKFRKVPDVEIERRVGRPTLRMLTEREAASQIDQGSQKTLKEGGMEGPRL